MLYNSEPPGTEWSCMGIFLCCHLSWTSSLFTHTDTQTHTERSSKEFYRSISHFLLVSKATGCQEKKYCLCLFSYRFCPCGSPWFLSASEKSQRGVKTDWKSNNDQDFSVTEDKAAWNPSFKYYSATLVWWCWNCNYVFFDKYFKTKY